VKNLDVFQSGFQIYFITFFKKAWAQDFEIQSVSIFALDYLLTLDNAIVNKKK